MLFGICIGVAIMITVASEVVSIHLLSAALAIIAMLAALVAFLTKNYIYMFESVVKKKGANLVIYGGEAFTMAPSGNSIVRREGQNVYASAFIKIPIYRSGTEMNKEEKADLSKLFGRILTLGKTPMKLSAEMYAVNKDQYITKLRAMLNETEEKYRSMQSVDGDQHRGGMERARGEVTMWRNLLDSVSKSHSQALVLFAMVSALGGNDEEASNIAYQRAEELAGGISATLGVNAYVAKGSELLTLLEPEYMIPVETVSERIRQKTMSGA
ncbi:MAG TPA: hypothetical protein VL945_00485 [Candidatus Saccharimonadales bacterium]|nr:hypothetical protein [Candidatus Saccharimonadales bacterium]